MPALFKLEARDKQAAVLSLLPSWLLFFSSYTGFIPSSLIWATTRRGVNFVNFLILAPLFMQREEIQLLEDVERVVEGDCFSDLFIRLCSCLQVGNV